MLIIFQLVMMRILKEYFIFIYFVGEGGEGGTVVLWLLNGGAMYTWR